MLFDSAILHAVAAEVRRHWLGRRVQHIQQNTYHETAIVVGAPRHLSTLQIVIAPDAARAHLISELASPGGHPPPFCMAVRKHLRGAVVSDVRQPRFDRILEIEFGECEGLGPACRRTLVAEIMGRYSNIILLDHHDCILACAKHITRRVNRYREIVEGVPYVSPPTGRKLDPLSVTIGELMERVPKAGAASSADKWLRDNTMGASRVWVAEVLARADVQPDAEVTVDIVERIWASFDQLRGELEAADGHAVIHHCADESAAIVYPVPLHHLACVRQTTHVSISAALEAVSAGEAAQRRAEQIRNRILQAVRSALKAASRRLDRLQEQLPADEDVARLRICGDAILANLASIERNRDTIQLPDPVNPERPPLTIEMDPNKSPSENAQAYYRRYKKAKQAMETIPPILKAAEQDIEYLQGVRFAAESTEDVEELEQILQELIEEGFINVTSNKKVRRQTPRVTPGRFTSSDGLTILYGRNNKQNEYIFRHESQPDDLWLHVRNAPGAHVIVKGVTGENVPERTLLEAAAIAAGHSILRNSNSVEVDYTLRKYVRKPKGARPGLVTYRNFRTVAVRPTSFGPPSPE